MFSGKIAGHQLSRNYLVENQLQHFFYGLVVGISMSRHDSFYVVCRFRGFVLFLAFRSFFFLFQQCLGLLVTELSES